jgi:selenocysteine lyase/cysteine desulfurase
VFLLKKRDRIVNRNSCSRNVWRSQKLQKEHVVVAMREGKIRVSPHLFNSERDIDRLINVVAA